MNIPLSDFHDQRWGQPREIGWVHPYLDGWIAIYKSKISKRSGFWKILKDKEEKLKFRYLNIKPN